MAFEKLHLFQEIASGSWRKLTNLLMVSDVVIFMTISRHHHNERKGYSSCVDNC